GVLIQAPAGHKKIRVESSATKRADRAPEPLPGPAVTQLSSGYAWSDLMGDLAEFADHPYRFIRKIVGSYFWNHAAIALAVIGAVTCSVSTQYGVKQLVDALSDPSRHTAVWMAFALLIGLLAADNMFWRIATWLCHSTYV